MPHIEFIHVHGAHLLVDIYTHFKIRYNAFLTTHIRKYDMDWHRMLTLSNASYIKDMHTCTNWTHSIWFKHKCPSLSIYIYIYIYTHPSIYIHLFFLSFTSEQWEGVKEPHPNPTTSCVTDKSSSSSSSPSSSSLRRKWQSRLWAKQTDRGVRTIDYCKPVKCMCV